MPQPESPAPISNNNHSLWNHYRWWFNYTDSTTITTCPKSFMSNNWGNRQTATYWRQQLALERLSMAVPQMLTPKPTTPPPDQEKPQPPIPEAPPQSATPTQPTNPTQPAPLNPPPQDAPPPVDHSTTSRAAPLPRPRNTTTRHPTSDYPPRVHTFFNDDTDNSEQDPTEIQPPSPDVMMSSTRTDFTYPPIEDLTKTLLKYAKNSNIRKLSYPTDLTQFSILIFVNTFCPPSVFYVA